MDAPALRGPKRRGVIAFLPGRRNPRRTLELGIEMGSRPLGILLVGLGVAVIVVGLLVWSGALSWVGRLPGDVRIERENVRFYFPITSMILISLVLTLILNLLRRLF